MQNEELERVYEKNFQNSRNFPRNIQFGYCGQVVKALDSQSRGPVFKTTGWLQGRRSLSSFRGR